MTFSEELIFSHYTFAELSEVLPSFNSLKYLQNAQFVLLLVQEMGFYSPKIPGSVTKIEGNSLTIVYSKLKDHTSTQYES